MAFFNYLPAYELNRSPRIIAAFDTDFLRNLDAFRRSLPYGRPFTLLLQTGWSVLVPKFAEELKIGVAEVRRLFPEARIIFLVNEKEAIPILKDSTECVWCHQNAFLDPGRYPLASVKSQTFADFEAICYVEESTERSLEMCRHAAADDARFKVVAAPKSGAVSATRNYAIDNAAGEYIVVLDGDDWLAPNMLEAIDARLRETGPVDIVSFAAVLVVSEGDSFEKSRRFSNFGVADASGVFTGIEALRRSGKYPQTWLCAYRTDFLRDHRLYQSEGLIMEDFGWRPRA